MTRNVKNLLSVPLEMSVSVKSSGFHNPLFCTKALQANLLITDQNGHLSKLSTPFIIVPREKRPKSLEESDVITLDTSRLLPPVPNFRKTLSRSSSQRIRSRNKVSPRTDVSSIINRKRNKSELRFINVKKTESVKLTVY